MATVDGKSFVIAASRTNQDGSGAKTGATEAVTDKFAVLGNPVLPVEANLYFRSTDESGRTTDLEEGAPTPYAVDMGPFTYPIKGSDHTIGYWSFWASHGGAAEAAPVEVVTAAGVYEHTHVGPQTDGVFLCPTIYCLADPTNGTDAQRNRVVSACVLEQYEETGQRKGLINVNLTIRGGGETHALTSTEETDYDALAYNSNQLFNFGMLHVLTNATLGENAANQTGAFAVAQDNGFADADAIAASNLVAAGLVSLTADLQRYALRFRQTPDPVASYAPGQLNSVDAGIVPDSGDYVTSPDGAANAELELEFTNVAGAAQEVLIDEVRAGTRRAFELWVVPGIRAATAVGGDSYRGRRVTFFEMHPVSWEMIPQGFGRTHIKVVYRPGYNAAAAAGWRVNTAWDEANALGG
jgi:hypothetical protein